MALNLTLTKQLTEIISSTLLGTYTKNGSNIDSSKYNKWTIGLLFNADYGF
jgi:hypothetical protein